MPQLPTYDAAHPREIPESLRKLLALGAEIREIAIKSGSLVEFSSPYFNYDVYEYRTKLTF